MSIRMESVEEMDLEADYRFVVDNKYAKYVRVEAGVYPDSRTMCCEAFLLPLLPAFPPGDWNEGTISRDESGKPFFSRTARVDFPRVKTVWHRDTFDLLSLQLDRKWPRAVHRVVGGLAPQLFDFPVVAKFTNRPDEAYKIEAETALYKLLDGTGIAPRFLGHLAENGRVMGFLMERLEGRPARPGSTADLDVCRAALRTLHERGIRHGDVNRQNFIIVHDDEDGGERAMLIDFSEVRYHVPPEDLADEMRELERKLNDPPETTGVRWLAEDGVTWNFEEGPFV